MGPHLCRISICGERKTQTPSNGLKERLIRENNTRLDLKLNAIQGRFITLIGVNGPPLSLVFVLPRCAPRNCRWSPFSLGLALWQVQNWSLYNNMQGPIFLVLLVHSLQMLVQCLMMTVQGITAIYCQNKQNKWLVSCVSTPLWPGFILVALIFCYCDQTQVQCSAGQHDIQYSCFTETNTAIVTGVKPFRLLLFIEWVLLGFLFVYLTLFTIFHF